MTQAQRIELVKTAPNMVEIGGLLQDVGASYLNRYANEQVKAPSDIDGQKQWVLTATVYFAFDIMRDKTELFNAIPARFHRVELYKKLKPIFA